MFLTWFSSLTSDCSVLLGDGVLLNERQERWEVEGGSTKEDRDAPPFNNHSYLPQRMVGKA